MYASDYLLKKNKKKNTFLCIFWVVTSTGPEGLMICECVLWREHSKAQPKVILEKPSDAKYMTLISPLPALEWNISALM